MWARRLAAAAARRASSKHTKNTLKNFKKDFFLPNFLLVGTARAMEWRVEEGAEVGKGSYGVVRRGRLRRGSSDVPVAVKRVGGKEGQRGVPQVGQRRAVRSSRFLSPL